MARQRLPWGIVKQITNRNAVVANVARDGRTAMAETALRLEMSVGRYYQLRLAEKYPRGEGVPKDLSAARFWANAALTNGEWAATNILSTISTTTNSLKDIK